MINFFKRSFCFFLIATFCLTCLCACGEGDSDRGLEVSDGESSADFISDDLSENGSSEDSGETSLSEGSKPSSEGNAQESEWEENTEINSSEEASEEESSEADESYEEGNGDAVIVFGTEISVSGTGAVVSEKAVVINEGGNYEIRGSSADGAVIVDTVSKVYVTLNGLQLTNKSGAAFYAKNAKRVVLTVAEGTENELSDGESYSGEFEDAKATLFANDTLEIKGAGSLSVSGSFKHAVASDDDIIVDGPSLTVISAATDALHANDNISVKSGSVTVLESNSDGFDSEGTLNVSGGTVKVNSVGEGMKCATSAVFSGGTVEINSTSDGIRVESADSSVTSSVVISGGNIKIVSLADGIQSASKLTVSGGVLDITTEGTALGASSGDYFDEPMVPSYGVKRRPGGTGGMGGMGGMMGESSSVSFAVSCKGIKSDGDLEICGGTVVINSADDAIHSAGELSLSGGKITVSTLDDGVHSDAALTVSGSADVTVLKSYEGLEGKTITISGGRVHVTASDDGLNAASGTGGMGGMGGRPGMASSENSLVISDAYVYVNSSGDGLDSNGALIVNSGLVIVHGPTNGGNGAIDADGTISMNGGTVVAAGSSGMLELPSQTSAQYSACLMFRSGLSANKTVCVKDSAGKTVLCFTPSKNSSCIVFSSELLRSGETYEVFTGGTAKGTPTDGVYADGADYSGGTSVGTFKINSKVQSFNFS